MPQLIKAANTKIITKNGECELSINVEPIVIEIKLQISSDGNVSVGGTQVSALNVEPQKPEPAPNWIIPSFGSQKIQFGKKD